MLVLGTLAVFAVLVVIMIGVIIFDDYKANEIEDKETKAERDVSVMFLYVCMFVDIRSPLSTNYFMLIKLLLSEYCTCIYIHIRTCGNTVEPSSGDKTLLWRGCLYM